MIEKIWNVTTSLPKNNTSGGWKTISSTVLKNKRVSDDDAKNTDSVIACLNIRAGTISKMPIRVYRRTPNGKEKVDNEVSYLLNIRPNKNMTPTMFKKLISYNVDLYGDCFVWIETKKGIPVGLWPLDPLSCNLENVNGNLWLTYNFNNKSYKIKYEQCLHFTDINFSNMVDGTLKGKSKLDVARTTIGNIKGSYELLEKYYEDGTLSKGLLSTPEPLDKEVKLAIKSGWKELNSGIDNADIAILDGGLTYQTLANSFADMCIVELSKLNKESIATVFQVPIHMLNSMDRATFNNIQQVSLDFIANTIQPLLTGWEEEYYYKLFTTLQQKEGLYAKFDQRVALRADDKSRAEYYEKMLQMGAYCINDVLELEDKNSIGKAGDIHRVRLDTVNVDIADEYQLSKLKVGEKVE